jgi:putative membrane protein
LRFMRMDSVFLLFLAFLGCMGGFLIGLVPGTHHLTPVAVMWALSDAHGRLLEPEQLAWISLGALLGWIASSILPATLLFAPDDAHPGWVLPGAKLLLRGRGLEAVLWQNLGALGALLALLALAPLFDQILRPLRTLLQPHTPWMLTAIIAFMLIGEWPRAEMHHRSRWRRLASAWGYIGISQLAFVLSGVLGLVLARSSLLPAERAYQSLLPAFSGLFALPGLLQLVLHGRRAPAQQAHDAAACSNVLIVLRGCASGVAGGFFAGFLPVISGGIGSLLAGHASAQRDERVFLVAHGAARLSYALFAALLLFLPGITLARGGLSSLISARWLPSGWPLFWTALGSAALCGVFAFAAQWRIAQVWARHAQHVSVRALAATAAALLLGLVLALTGVPGLAVLAVASAIGLLPVLFGTRRLNCLAVVLVPATLNMLGVVL